MSTGVALVVVLLAVIGLAIGAGVGLRRRPPPPGFDVLPPDERNVKQ